MYETLLAELRQERSAQQAVREFVAILQLHQSHPAVDVAAAIEMALADKLPHLAGVTFCLHKLQDATPQVTPLDLAWPLTQVGSPPVPATAYNQLLRRVVA